MPIQVHMHTPDRRHLSRNTFRGWDVDANGWITWGDMRYRVDPEYFERRPYRPFWHFMFLFPLLMPRREMMSISYVQGDPQPRKPWVDPVLDNLVTTGTAGGIFRLGKQRTVNDFTFPRKADPIMMLLILSILGNIILIIVVALKSVKF